MWVSCTARNCRPCCSADPTTDTIKVEESSICHSPGASRAKSICEGHTFEVGALAAEEPSTESWPSPVREQFSAIQLLSRLRTRLWQEGLDVCDMPDATDRDFGLLLTELGFESALERAKLRKAVRDFMALRCPSDTKRSVGTLSTMASTDYDIASQVSSDFVPALGAYYTGEKAEYFSKHLCSWMPAEVMTESRATGHEVVYSATVLPHRQEHYDVGLAALRLPLRAGEPCEVLSQDFRWIPAVASSGQQITQSAISYRVSLLEGQMDEIQIPASQVRRRFPPGSLVSVYQRPGLGWTNAMVVSGGAGTSPERAADCSPNEVCASTPHLLPQPEVDALDPERQNDVLICTEAGDAIEQLLHVSPHVLRFRHEYVHQYALWGPLREEAASSGRRENQSVLMKQESFAVTPSVDSVV